LRKATICFVMFVRPFASNNLAPAGRILIEFNIWVFFEKLSRKFKFQSYRTRITLGYFTWRQIYTFLSHLAQFFLEWERFQTKVVEKVKTHILCSLTFFENRAVYEIMWKYTVEQGRPHMTIWRTRIACWITKVNKWRTKMTKRGRSEDSQCEGNVIGCTPWSYKGKWIYEG
jgi:hypothetical protein